MSTNHEAYKELMKEVDHPTNLQVVEASITDLRQRQFNTYIESGLSEAEAVAMSGYKIPHRN